VDPNGPWLIPFREVAGLETGLIGGKAERLAQLRQAGFRTPEGFCITTFAYRNFLERNRLVPVIQMELGRKPLDEMRWEEIWDAALRIRSAFLDAPLPPELVDAVGGALASHGSATHWAVRSSAPAEDAEGYSFAGLHESRVDLVGSEAVLDAVRVVWASLWSDAALLYRRELGLDPAHSAMAVLVQQMIRSDRSGVAFARDPRAPQRERAIVEAVPGPCSDLVDGSVDPDRWTLSRPSGTVLDWRPGSRGTPAEPEPLLEASDLATLVRTLLAVESLFGWPPDIEWTDRDTTLALLQARPITSLPGAEDDTRAWYLSLRPGAAQLARLCDRVEHELIPQLSRDSEEFASVDLERCDDIALARAIDERSDAFTLWRRIYREEFIPLAHGVRQLGSYYDEAVRPKNPYEFVGLLAREPLAAAARNERILALADLVRANAELRSKVLEAVRREEGEEQRAALARVARSADGRAFVHACDELLSGAMDVCYAGERLADRIDLLLRLVVALAKKAPAERIESEGEAAARELERRLFDAVGPARHDEARDVLRIARVSWRLRDDDNLLLGRIESQLLRAVGLGLERLRRAGRLEGEPPVESELASIVSRTLRDPSDERIAIGPSARTVEATPEAAISGSPRQLVGQPAAPGLSSGPARRIRGAGDLGRFRDGEVIVCDAIQPTMTQLVPLCSAIVERRGGMLIHGAIIARELGVPCVNGVAAAVEQVRDGEWLTVDGNLGLVTVGQPEFDLERER
jgi:pyruvate,water dikinase